MKRWDLQMLTPTYGAGDRHRFAIKRGNHHRPLGWLVLALSLLLATDSARADDRWLFVPVLASQPPRDISVPQLTSAFEIELRASSQNVISNGDAGVLFEARHSSEPVKLNTDEMSRLLRSVGQAARHLALGELPQAQQAMEGVYALSGPARDYLNREAARARKIFDTCLMTAYLWERDQKRPQALRQMLECSRSFPGFRPEGRAYPPELREIFEAAKAQLNQEAATTLLVQSRQSSGCGVRLNGIEVGKSPMSFSDARAGITRVQLECETGVAGRIHSVELKPGENRLDIDPAFDAVVHTQGGLWLQYDSEAARTARADADLAQLQKAVGAKRIVGLVVEGSSYPRVHVRSMSPAPAHEVASLSYSVGEGYSPEAVAAALKSLRSGGGTKKKERERENRLVLPEEQTDAPASIELFSEAPPPLPPEEETPPAAPPPAQGPVEHQNMAAGALLAVAGIGGVAVGWVLYTKRYQHRRISNDPVETGADYSVPTPVPQPGWTLFATGAGLVTLTISEYFWLPDAEGVPGWAWVVGGLGVAVVAAGLAVSALGPSCPEKPSGEDFPVECFGYTSQRIFGPMLAMHGLPLIGIPLSYGLRALTQPPQEEGADQQPQAPLDIDVIRPPSGGLVLQVRGVF
jgi:hypothetical protein